MHRFAVVLLITALWTLPVLAQQTPPDDPDQVLTQAQQFYEDANYYGAVGLLESAISAGVTSDPALYVLLARSYWALDSGYEYNIVLSCDTALQRDSDLDECRALRAAAGARSGDEVTARADLSALETRAPDQYLLLRGAAFAALGDWAAAGQMYQRWLDAQEPRRGRTTAPLGLGTSPITLRLSAGREVLVPLDGTAGMRVFITTYSASYPVETLLVLRDPQGQPIAGDHMGEIYYPGDSMIRGVELPSTGTYTLVVTPGEHPVNGSITLLWRAMTADDYITLGESAFTRRAYTRAIEEFERALSMGAGDEFLYERLSRAYYLTNNHAGAVEMLNRAIEFSPDYPGYYQSRAVSYAELGNYAQALDDLDYACQLALGCDEGLLLARGIVYTLAGQPALAGRDYYDWLNRIRTQRRTLPDPLEDGQPYVATMTFGLHIEIPLRGRAGDTFVITAESVPETAWVDPLLVVLDRQHQPLDGDDDRGGGLRDQNSRVVFTLPADGDYWIVLGHAGGGSEGEIAVTVAIGQ